MKKGNVYVWAEAKPQSLFAEYRIEYVDRFGNQLTEVWRDGKFIFSNTYTKNVKWENFILLPQKRDHFVTLYNKLTL